MTTFSYTGRDNGGKKISGNLEAASMDQAASELSRQGIMPITLKPSKEKSTQQAEPAKKKKSPEKKKKEKEEPESMADMEIDLDIVKEFFEARQKIDIEELIIFCRQMGALLAAGVPIIKAIKGLGESSENVRFKRVLIDIVDKLNSGMPLATAMQNHSDVFTPFIISMIHVGETTGRLDGSFREMAAYLDFERSTRKRIKSATRYPVMVLSAITVAVLVINIWVVPTFANVFQKFGADLPLATRILVGTSNFLLNYGWILFIAVCFAFYSLKKYINTPVGRYNWDKLMISLPLSGKIYKRISLSRFCRTFATLMESGVPVLQSLSVVAHTVHNDYIGKKITDMHSAIEAGGSLSSTAAGTGLFSQLVLQMLVIGEETGAVDKLLHDVADFYDQEIDYDLKHLSDTIEPILLAFMGAMVLVLALGVFLPIWNLSDVAIKK